MSFGTGPLLDRDAGRGMEVRLGMTKSDATGAQSLEEILAQIKKSVAGGTAEAAGAGEEAGSRPADGGLSARLAGVLKDAGSGTSPDRDYTELRAADQKAPGQAAADPAKPMETRRQAADPLWFLRQPGGTAPQDDTPAQTAQTPPETGATLMEGEIKLSRPQDLRASLPPLFGTEDQQPPLARMPAAPLPEAPPSPPPAAAPGTMAGLALDNIHTAKTQPLVPPPEVAGESPDGVGMSEPKPEPEVQAVAPAATTLAEPSPEASRTVEAKLDDTFHPQAHAASIAMAPPLAEPAGVKSTSPGAGPQARSLEQVIGELLEPVIRQWLEANLPRLVEEVVRKEVARAIAAERPTSVV
jgi:cell pole-organizing protein PopZ